MSDSNIFPFPARVAIGARHLSDAQQERELRHAAEKAELLRQNSELARKYAEACREIERLRDLVQARFTMF